MPLNFSKHSYHGRKRWRGHPWYIPGTSCSFFNCGHPLLCPASACLGSTGVQWLSPAGHTSCWGWGRSPWFPFPLFCRLQAAESPSLSRQNYQFSLWLHFSSPGLEIQICLPYLVSALLYIKAHVCFPCQGFTADQLSEVGRKRTASMRKPQGSRNLPRFSPFGSWLESLTPWSSWASALAQGENLSFSTSRGHHLTPTSA